ncbi:MAG TPA: MBL fold metallo-hydrolase [Candidatus Limnocylindrales bacterium]|nr:MBL fold metallo-hydrolase [Candidatus Limnocylindrales bacterium]
MTTTLDALTITKLSVGPMDNNAYLLRCQATGATLMIDAANESDQLLELCGGTLDAVLTTHQHADHWQALEDVVAATGARTYAGRLDAEGIPVETQMLVDDGDIVQFGEIQLEAIHLVGHTPGSIALLYQDPTGHPHLFTGDCLFPGGPGRTTNPTEFASLMGGLEEKVFGRLPDETAVYPGHGKDTTLGKERSSIPEWRARGW